MHNNESDPAKSSESEKQVLSGLADHLDSRRKELGYHKLPATGLAQATKNMPLRELTPETEEARRQAEEAEAKRALRQRAAERQGMLAKFAFQIGGRYEDCRLETYRVSRKEQQAAVDAVREYASTLIDRIAERQGVVLYGPVGTGKDHLAFTICREAILKHGRNCQWVNGQNWFGDNRDGIKSESNERAAIERLCRSSLLMLSDPLPPFGNLGDYQASMLYRLIDTRYARGLPVICTVNVAGDDEAWRRMGAATWDRLCHDAWKIRCVWPSYRKPARTVNQ